MNRYTLIAKDGKLTVFEARPGDVRHEEFGIRRWVDRNHSRFYPYVSFIEERCERVEWRAVQ